MPTEIQKGNSILRPRARLIKTIGEELISSDVVAVMELVLIVLNDENIKSIPVG